MDESPKDFKYQPWTRSTGTPAESLTRIKGLVQYRCWDWSSGIDPWYQSPKIYSESDEEIHDPTVDDEAPPPEEGPRPTKRGLKFRIDR
eukprot:3459417-Heterocapsa_arctica.AAC.1